MRINLRRSMIGLGALVLVGTAGLAVYAGVRHCATGKPEANGVPSAEPARGAIAGNFDLGMSGVCRFACATKLDYEPADVIAQPGAQPGKLTQCPVSGVVFVVGSDRPAVPVKGNDYVTCCGNCAVKLQKEPRHYLKA